MLSSLFVVLFPVNYLARTEGNYSLKHSVTHPQVMLSFFSIHFQFIIPLHLFIFSTDRPLSQTYTQLHLLLIMAFPLMITFIQIKCIHKHYSIPHHQVLGTLLGWTEQESTEQWDPHAVTQYCQIGLCELKCCWVLVHNLPHAVQEQQEQWGLYP